MTSILPNQLSNFLQEKVDAVPRTLAGARGRAAMSRLQPKVQEQQNTFEAMTGRSQRYSPFNTHTSAATP